MDKLILKKYLEAEKYINEGLIRTSVSDLPDKLTRREWMLKFLNDLGHPEKSYPAVHVAGTSGKGSTAAMIAEILKEAGYRVGLHTTPYLQVATEKLWVDGKYASAKEFIELVEWIKPICERWRAPEVPLHGLASFGICLEHFRRQKIDIAVIETGVGGRDDLTNVLDSKISVITPLGIDHVKTLGNTIESIAEHKAGIIREKTNVVAYRGAGSGVIERVADQRSAPLTWISEPAMDYESGMPGTFQNINAKIAATTASILNTTHFDITNEHIKSGISKARLPARMEIVSEHPTILIDGAHNVQKLRTLFKELDVIPKELDVIPAKAGILRNQMYPPVKLEDDIKGAKTDPRNITFIFGLLESKFNNEIFEMFDGVKSGLILTKPCVYGKDGLEPAVIAEKLGNSSSIEVISDPLRALKHALTSCNDSGKIVVTGSLYLAGNIRGYFYPTEKVLFERTSWPESLQK